MMSMGLMTIVFAAAFAMVPGFNVLGMDLIAVIDMMVGGLILSLVYGYLLVVHFVKHRWLTTPMMNETVKLERRIPR